MADITVYDVAKKAKVSIATVSRVLNSPEKVNEGTRKRVLATIDSLGFVPKAEAAARARKGNGRIGVLAPFFLVPSFVQRLRGVATALADSPYELAIYYVDSSARRDGYLGSLSVTRRLDGLIVMALPFDDVTAQRLVKHGIESVLIEFARPSFSSIEIDDEAGGQLAAEYLISKRHHRCAFIGDKDLPDYAIHTSDRRLAGYRKSLGAAGISLPNEYVSLAQHGMEQACQQTHGLLNLPEPPSAIFAPSDVQAMGALKAARERGISVPNQLAIVGFDDLEMSDYIGLTTVHQPLEESGRVAVELLLARLTDPARPVQHIKLPLSIVQRGTA